MRITLPHVGESVTEAVIERWLKQVGDRVEKYEPLAEVVTDKVSMEMPSPLKACSRTSWSMPDRLSPWAPRSRR